jgi:hypothetical protein
MVLAHRDRRDHPGGLTERAVRLTDAIGSAPIHRPERLLNYFCHRASDAFA